MRRHAINVPPLRKGQPFSLTPHKLGALSCHELQPTPRHPTLPRLPRHSNPHRTCLPPPPSLPSLQRDWQTRHHSHPTLPANGLLAAIPQPRCPSPRQTLPKRPIRPPPQPRRSMTNIRTMLLEQRILELEARTEPKRMMLLCGQSNRVWHYLAGRYPGSVGMLISPSYAARVPLDPWMPFVVDNGAFIAWKAGSSWEHDEWLNLLEKLRQQGKFPRWIAVPDVVGNREGTIRAWNEWSEIARTYGPLAYCVQDGMKPSDVPRDADVVFVGGNDGWKFPNLPMWTENFPRVHCARVNEPAMIERCEELGCESVDGTGWFRDPSRKDKAPAIINFVTGYRKSANQPQLAL